MRNSCARNIRAAVGRSSDPRLRHDETDIFLIHSVIDDLGSASTGDFQDQVQGIDSLGLGEYADGFEAERIDLETLPELSDEDLKGLGLPLGPRRKILRAARSSPPTSTSTAPDEPPSPGRPVRPAAGNHRGSIARPSEPTGRHGRFDRRGGSVF